MFYSILNGPSGVGRDRRALVEKESFFQPGHSWGKPLSGRGGGTETGQGLGTYPLLKSP